MILWLRLAAAVAFSLAVASAAAIATAQMTATQAFAPGIVGQDGSISLPANFRRDWVMLGAWSVEGDADTGGSVGLHVVYAPGSVVDAYRKTGKFPDGAVLVKELFNGRTETLTTGEATSAASLAGHFVMVKDAKSRFPDNPLWGDGWGWAFFAAGKPETPVTKDYKTECLACHEPVRANDLVYDYAYPVLKK